MTLAGLKWLAFVICLLNGSIIDQSHAIPLLALKLTGEDQVTVA